MQTLLDENKNCNTCPAKAFFSQKLYKIYIEDASKAADFTRSIMKHIFNINSGLNLITAHMWGEK